MNLLKNFINLINDWKDSFSSFPTFKRSQDLCIGSLCASHPQTLTSIISFINNSDQDWSANYYFFSRSKWEVKDLFNPLIKQCLSHFDKNPYIVVAVDDSSLKKTGKKIKTAFWQRDRMSPAFHPNLIWGQRFIQVSLTLPLYHFDREKAPRGIPVRFIEAPIVKKPKKKAPNEEWQAFKEARKKINLSLQCKEEMKKFREDLDSLLIDKPLLETVDGAFCNRNFLKGHETKKTIVVARCRKDIQLCHQTKNPKNKQHFYDKKTFTPEAIYKDQKIPWKKALIFRAGRYRQIKYKEVSKVFWRTVLQKQSLKLLVLKRIPYHPRKGHVSFRDPAYLLCTKPEIDSRIAIQSYHDHPQIELNLKEEKSILGVGKAQVRTVWSVQKQPAFVVASYATLLVAALNTPHVVVEFPRWRKEVKRVGVAFLIKQLKKDLLLQFFAIEDYKPPPKILKMLLKRAT